MKNQTASEHDPISDDDKSAIPDFVSVDLTNDPTTNDGATATKEEPQSPNNPRKENPEDTKRMRRIMRNRKSAKESRVRRRALLASLSEDVEVLSAEKKTLSETNAQLLAELEGLKKRQKSRPSSRVTSQPPGPTACTGFDILVANAGCGTEEDGSSTSTVVSDVTHVPSKEQAGEWNGVEPEDQQLTIAKKSGTPGPLFLAALRGREDALSVQNQTLVRENARLRAGMQDVNQQLMMALGATRRQRLWEQETAEVAAASRITRMGISATGVFPARSMLRPLQLLQTLNLDQLRNDMCAPF